MSRHLKTLGTNASLAKIKVLSLEKAASLSKFVDDFLGVSEVISAQQDVQSKELEFLTARRDLQKTKDLLRDKTQALRETRKRLDRCSRDDENYLVFVSEEHKLLLEEKDLRSEYAQKEDNERNIFAKYSASVRISHEQERVRAERTKYWSIIGSVSGTVIGFLLSSGITYYRFKQIREIAKDGGLSNLVQELKTDLSHQSLQTADIQEKLRTATELVERKIEEQKELLTSSLAKDSTIPEETINPAPAADSDRIGESYEQLNCQLQGMNDKFSQKIVTLEEHIKEECGDLKSCFREAFQESQTKLETRLERMVKYETSENENDLNAPRYSDSQESTTVTIDDPCFQEDTWYQKANLAIGITGVIILFYSVFVRGT